MGWFSPSKGRLQLRLVELEAKVAEADRQMKHLQEFPVYLLTYMQNWKAEIAVIKYKLEKA